ncbi:MAG TPA: hypothetical protein VFR41_12715, partial [Acidimicrobiia bacterium]|nr:hypothetical protein [Acidimicrobiia bacterium]
MTDAPGRGVRVRYYAAARRGGDVELELADAFRPELAVDEGCLVGPRTLVSTRTVLIERTADGLRGIPAPEIEVRDGALVFDPSQGGARIRQNRRARGAFNRIVAEANWFGMVNAYVHIADAAVRLDRLLEDIGAAPPPRVAVVVGAHAGSKLPGYCQGDGDRRSGAIRPLSGGHYRVSTRTKGVLEPYPVLGTGEIHLGP